VDPWVGNGAPAPGTVLAGKYRVERVLGQGGMGVVVAAWHTVLEERVALKFLRADAVHEADVLARFLQEARASVRLKSQHVARVLDVGTLESGSPFIVMEYLEGRDLAAVLAAHPGGLPVPEAVDFVLQAVDAIAEAHAIGIVHRDLKLSNLFAVPQAEGQALVKVLDFGISKVSFDLEQRAAANLTRSRDVVGSPVYMSPEQFRSAKKVDHRTDQWSLGVILYELLVGAPPFDGETMGELFVAILESASPPMGGRRPDVAPELEAIVARCLRKSRDERFADIGELAEALAPYGTGRWSSCVRRAVAVLRSPTAGPGSSPDAVKVFADSGRDLPAAHDPTVPATPSPHVQSAGAWNTSISATARRPSTRRTIRISATVGGLSALLLTGAAGYVALRAGKPGAESPPPASVAATAALAPPQPERSAAPSSASPDERARDGGGGASLAARDPGLSRAGPRHRSTVPLASPPPVAAPAKPTASSQPLPAPPPATSPSSTDYASTRFE
jgi:serine/threonine-protein kinase